MTLSRSPSRETLEKVFRLFPYALFVVVAGDWKQSMAMVATWATQVSFHPPMVALAIERESRIRAGMDAAASFSMNFLAGDAKGIAAQFLKTPVSEGSVIAGQPLAHSADGIPLLASARASLGCRIAGMYEAGDHLLYVGEVVEAVLRTDGDVLALKDTGWRYFR